MRFLTILNYSDTRAPAPDYRARSVIYAGTQAGANAVAGVFGNMHGTLRGGDDHTGGNEADESVTVEVVRTDDDTVVIGDEVIPVSGSVAKSDVQF